MGKFVVRILSAVLACLTSYVAIIWMFGFLGISNWLPVNKSFSGGYGQMLLRMREAKEVKNVDVLFVGSSQVYRGFDPRIFNKQNINIFNLGSSAQTPLNSYYLLKEYLPVMKPKVVVLDLYWGILTNTGEESSIDILSNSEIKPHVLEMMLATKSSLVLSSFAGNLLQRLHRPISKTRQEDNKKDKYIAGGFTETNVLHNTLSSEQLLNFQPQSISLAGLSRQINYIQKIISLCKEQQIKIALVITPVTNEYQSRILNYEKYHEEFSRIADQNKIPLFDYNQRKGLNLDSMIDFYDKNHLTQTGVRKFNQLFIRDLHRKSLMPGIEIAKQ